jgi:hypothetical protein
MRARTFSGSNVTGSRWPVAMLLALAAFLVPRGAGALEAIGTAILVEGQVSGSFSGQTSPLAKGDGVVSNEVVRTQSASSGEISFVDQTKLFVGPVSTVTLDQFVFDQSGAASRFTIGVSKGALRIISGRSEHGAYGVKTPFGSLGLRGTIADVVVERLRVIVTDKHGIDEGPVIVTARNGQSLTLLPGQSAILSSSGVSGPLGPQGSDLPDFETACGGGCTLMFAFGGPLGVPQHDVAGRGLGGSGYDAKGSGQNSSSGSSSEGSSSGSVTSDIRAKRDIRSVAVLPSGIHLYRFRYRWSDEEYVGVMAQEVQRARPDAVSQGTDGYLRVNYGRLGLRFMTWSEWQQSRRYPSL